MKVKEKKRLRLVPRFKGQGYKDEEIRLRRRWLEEQRGLALDHIAGQPLSGESMRGNIENPIGTAQTPLGVVGPILVHGEHADGHFYVPMATTEGALLRSYERGMVALTRCGGVTTRVYRDENSIYPTFFFEHLGQAMDFARDLGSKFEDLRREAEATTRHGRLLKLDIRPLGRQVLVGFCYATGDAHGMNMIVKATDRACRWLMAHCNAKNFHIFSGYGSEKRASGMLFAGGKGKRVSAGALLPAAKVKAYFHVSPRQLQQLWQQTVLGHMEANAVGFNAHYANGLAAIFIACGQDVANIANSSVGISCLEVTEGGDLYASVNLTSLTLATVGGGTGLGSNRECLEIMDCFGSGKAKKLAEIVAATLLAGEISFSAAIASGEFVEAHETYGRNRPEELCTE